MCVYNMHMCVCIHIVHAHILDICCNAGPDLVSGSGAEGGGWSATVAATGCVGGAGGAGVRGSNGGTTAGVAGRWGAGATWKLEGCGQAAMGAALAWPAKLI